VKNVGKPCAGKPHARFDGRGLETGRDLRKRASPRPYHFVVFGLSSLVVAGFGAVLVASAPAGPGPDGGAAGDGGDQVCQETADLAEREADEAAARAFGAIAAVTAR
jgi:hypothetical protein